MDSTCIKYFIDLLVQQYHVKNFKETLESYMRQDKPSIV